MKTKQISFTFDLNRYEGGMCSIMGNMSNIPKFIQRDMSDLKSGDRITVNSYKLNDDGKYVTSYKQFELKEI